MADDDSNDKLDRKPAPDVVPAGDEHLPPVVARMVVEIRSDGSRTIARGAMEDVQNGKRVDIRAEADSPIALAWKLVKSIAQTPSLAQNVVRGLLPGAKKRK